jgi:hypothetical protein
LCTHSLTFLPYPTAFHKKSKFKAVLFSFVAATSKAKSKFNHLCALKCVSVFINTQHNRITARDYSALFLFFSQPFVNLCMTWNDGQFGLRDFIAAVLLPML